MTEIISSPWNSGDLPDRQHCCSSNPGAPLAKTFWLPCFPWHLSYMSVILHDFPWHVLIPLSNCLSMPVGKTQQGWPSLFSPMHLKRCEDMATVCLSCLVSESSWHVVAMGMKEGHAPDPQISSICILSEFSYVPFLYCLKIAQVRNLFRQPHQPFLWKEVNY